MQFDFIRRWWIALCKESCRTVICVWRFREETQVCCCYWKKEVPESWVTYLLRYILFQQISYVNFVTVTICYDQSIDHGQKWILLCQTNLTIHIVWSLRKYFSWIQIWLTAKAFISIGHVVIRIFCWMFLDNISKYAHNRCKTISLKLANMAEIVDVPH